MPGGSTKCQPSIWTLSHTMQMKKNQILHGTFGPSSDGSGWLTLVVMGTMAADGGQVAQMGRTSVDDDVVVVAGALLQDVTNEQSSTIVDEAGPRKVTALDRGQE